MDQLSAAEWRVAIALHSSTCGIACSSIRIQRQYGRIARIAIDLAVGRGSDLVGVLGVAMSADRQVPAQPARSIDMNEGIR